MFSLKKGAQFTKNLTSGAVSANVDVGDDKEPPFEDTDVCPQTSQTHEYDVDVAADDIDEMGHVNNAVYLKWVQAAVLSHWRRVAPKEVAAAHLWVALKHEIRYLHPAFLNDHVVVKVVLRKAAWCSGILQDDDQSRRRCSCRGGKLLVLPGFGHQKAGSAGA